MYFKQEGAISPVNPLKRVEQFVYLGRNISSTEKDVNIRINRLIGLVGRVFTNGPGDLSSIPGRVITETLKMILDTSLLNTQKYKVRIKGKVEQPRESCSTLPYTSV